MVIDEIKQVVQLIERPEYSESILRKQDAYLQCSVCVGILSQTIDAASDAERKSLAHSAEQMLVRAIDSGYRNLDYLKTDPDFEWLQKSTMLDSISERIENLHATK